MSDELFRRIDAAIDRIIAGHSPQRIPADLTDPDIVLTDCRRALEAERAAHEETRKAWARQVSDQQMANEREIHELKARAENGLGDAVTPDELGRRRSAHRRAWLVMRMGQLLSWRLSTPEMRRQWTRGRASGEATYRPPNETETAQEAIEREAEAAGVSAAEWVRRAAGYCAAVRVPLVHVQAGPLPGEVE